MSAQPVDRDGIDWGVHRGSCRIFYAERRCTCGAVGEQDMLADYFATMRSIAAEDPVLLARIDRAEKAAAAAEQTGAGEEAAECNDVCEAWGCNPPQPAPSAHQPGAGEEADDGQTVQLGPVKVLRDGKWVDAVPAPSAGQDTGQMRDEDDDWRCADCTTAVDCPPCILPGYRPGRLRDEVFDWLWRTYAQHVDVRVDDADALLDGPLRQLIAERDKARAQVRDAWAQTVRRSCGCWQGIGRLDPGCHRFGLCSLEISRDGHTRAPSAGQDTGQMRDEIARVLADQTVTVVGYNVRTPMTAEGIVGRESARSAADMLLDGPLRQLIAERDKYRAQVQRVREVVEAPSSGYLDIEIRRALDPS